MATWHRSLLLRAWLVIGILCVAGCHRSEDNPAAPAQSAATPAASASAASHRAIRLDETSVSCEGVASWQDAFSTINGGGLVTNRGGLYECTPGASSPWCRQAVYEPGTDQYYPPPDWWPQAWTFKGTCGGSGFEGNRLTVVMPPEPAHHAAATKDAARDDKPLSGVLRCPLEPGHDLPIHATWGETVTIDKLPPCNYQLIVNAAGGYRPLKTPAVIAVTEPKGQEVHFEVQFAPPFPIEKLRALPGVRVEIFARGLIQPRQMAMGDNVLYVGSSAIPQYAGEYGDIAGFIYALPLDPASHRPTGELYLVATQQIEPHGVAYHHGTLYYATTGKLYRLEHADSAYRDPHPVAVLNFPADDLKFPLPLERNVSIYRRWHQKHPLYFDPARPDENKLYTSVGIPCNICRMASADDRYGSLMVYDLDTGSGTLLAQGIRNSVGMDWNPATHELWFSDNNRQTTGQDPVTAVRYPEEINRLSRERENFGVPYVFGRTTIGYTQDEFTRKTDPNAPTGLLPGISVGDRPPATIRPGDYTAPALELAAGAAPLGIKFIDHATYPGTGEAQSQNLLIAAHGAGSDNDGSPNIRLASIEQNRVTSVWPFVMGWKQPDGLLGRPTDFLALADGSLLVSDDVGNVIYRISYDPAQLPDTSVRFHMGAAPGAPVQDSVPGGVLVDASGHRWPFQLAWNTSSTLKGLAPGAYRVEMADLGDYTATEPVVHVELEPNGSKTVELAYRARPSLEAAVTIKAPPRPAGEGVPNQWVVTLITDGQPRSISLPWDGQTVEHLAYGVHELIYPYMPHAIPVPSRSTVRVVDDTPQTEQTTYHPVEDIGKTMLGTAPDVAPGSGGCSRCHTDGLAGNPGIAMGWAKEGREALRNKILDMSARIENGHCDGVCATQIAAYLFDDVWKEYIEPQESFGARQLRKLTRDEYARSVKDLLNVDVDVDYLPPDSPDKYFVYPGEASRGVFDKSQVRAYYDEALRVAAKVDLRSIGYVAGRDDAAFIRDLGHQVFRRALSDGEVARYLALMQQHDDGMEGPRRLVAGLLVSPYFLYRSELGVAAPGKSDTYRLTPDEMATALSFGFLGTTPSKALLQEAEAGGLDTPEKVQAKINAMIATDAGKDHFLEFIRYYTRTTLPPDEKAGLDASLAAAMWEEQARFVRDVIGQPTTGTVRTLFNPGYTYLNKALAEHYGIAGVDGNVWVKKQLDTADRERWGGLLQQGAFLASRAASDANVTSLIRRGFTVRENLLCRKFATQENDNEPITYPDRPIGMREHWNLRTKGSDGSVRTCWSCHQFVNDVGASMEHYDQTATYRDKEFAVNQGYHDQQVDIDASGPLISNGGSLKWIDFADVRGISQYLPRENQAMRCLADSYYRYVYGEYSGVNGAKLVNDVTDTLMSSGRLQDMLRQLGSADALRYRKERTAPAAIVHPVPPDAPPNTKQATLHWPAAANHTAH